MLLNKSLSWGGYKSWDFFFEIIEFFVGSVPVDWFNRVVDDVEVFIHLFVLGDDDGLVLWTPQDYLWISEEELLQDHHKAFLHSQKSQNIFPFEVKLSLLESCVAENGDLLSLL